MTKKTLFSGIQPSGSLTIGNYMGAFKQWLDMQQEYQCIFSIVDLHAITVQQDPDILRKNILDTLALLIACGIDTRTSTLFIQSTVPEHTELAWILNCYAYMGELSRMTQFKDKSTQHNNNINLGLFAYPCLQAADILLYKTDIVPVGADQKQHIELCRDIAMRFNKQHHNIFNVPRPYIPEQGDRIMSLQDPNKKMSKSDPSSLSYISLLDSPELIHKKLKKSVTDSEALIKYDQNDKPGVANLLTLLHLSNDTSIAELEQTFSGQGYGHLKSAVADSIIKLLSPIQKTFQEIRPDTTYLNGIIKNGQEKARETATQTIDDVKKAIGIVGR